MSSGRGSERRAYERRAYEEMPLPELEERERRAREAFRDALGDLQDRITDEGERVSGAAKRAQSIAQSADAFVRRHRLALIAASVGVGALAGYRRKRVVAERAPGERNEEYVLVRRERKRASPVRAGLAKLAALAATEAMHAAGQLMSEAVRGDAAAAPGDAESAIEPDPAANGGARQAGRASAAGGR